MQLVTAILALAALLCAPSLRAQDYQVQPGDRLDISVLEDPGLNRQVLVGPDGRISVPLAGSIVAGGRSTEEIRVAIRRGLARDFVEPPTVTVSLLGVADPRAFRDGSIVKVYVLGEVGAPGPYEVELPIDALQMLAIAGGPGVFAARKRIQIRRRGPGTDNLLLFDYDLVERGATPVDRISLRDGDVIIVPARRLFE